MASIVERRIMAIMRKWHKVLNGKTPVWFREWYAMEFVPLKIRIDLAIVLTSGILIGVVILVIASITD